MRTASVAEESYTDVGVSDKPLFTLVEGVLRRFQTACNLPYLGLFDSYRFYEACWRNLGDCEIIQERCTLFSIGTSLAKHRLGKPYVLFLDADELLELDYQGKSLSGIQRLVARTMFKFSLRQADVVICMSEYARDHFVNFWGVTQSKIRIVPNGVDTELFRPDLDASDLQQKMGLGRDPLAVCVCGFWPWHDVRLLIQAFRQVLKERADAKLILVGNGPTFPTVQRYIFDNQLQSSIILTGAVEHSEVPKYLALADIAVAAWASGAPEHFSPMKIYEYMAAGKAIISSRSNQSAAVLRDGYSGILVEAGNSSAFARQILGLFNNPSGRERLGRNARLDAENNHSWERRVRQLEQIYNSLHQQDP